ncbi:L,D-transpeptidase [Agrobacterium vitis]|nr:L,D-transpeptidase [Agrobacterium vitis]MCE6075500.1 L,D-transpeptidase family protein [Agrobacterium vitis]MCF1465370.1 L,D-transpeptidase [Agrobacterium vitis]MUO72558.1 L,D-transpeptidase family protein [Agrobacterium vitis]MUO86491.1 L,D-transpeptidase family protein [Agrobacterium vitis]MVA34515.1 L,D-transpeptidase family protein [Agrobacterium vitis]
MLPPRFLLKASLAMTLALILPAITGQAVAQDRYQIRPPVVVSPDLAAPWLLQLGVRAEPPAVNPGRPSAAQPVYYRPVTKPVPQPYRQPAASVAPLRPALQQASAMPAPRQMSPTPAQFLPQVVAYQTREKPGTLVIDTNNRFLYLVMDGGMARRYGVGVGKPGFEWAGEHKVTRKTEWPEWIPPQEMIAREAAKGHYLPARMQGGPENPLGARALYLGSTLYRIHGTNAPWTIGYGVSSGCIRMRNQDVTDLYGRVPVGTKVIVM